MADKPLKIYQVIPEMYPRMAQFYKGQFYDGSGNLIPGISNPGEYRILVSDGSTTGSVGYGNFTFNGTTLIVGNGSVSTSITNNSVTIQNGTFSTASFGFNYLVFASGSNTMGLYDDHLSFSSSSDSLVVRAGGVYNIGELIFDGRTQSDVSGTQSLLYYDKKREALAYFSNGILDSPILLGKQEVVRIYNDLGFTLLKGQPVYMDGSVDGVPYVNLSNASSDTTSFVSGLVKEDILPGEYGMIVQSGLLDEVDLTLVTIGTVSVNDRLYLSDKISGYMISNPYDQSTGLSYSSRTDGIGYVLSTGTQGSIYIHPDVENTNLSITDRQRNILEGNVLSTGVFQFDYPGLTISSDTTIDISPMRGWVVDNTGSTYSVNPVVKLIEYVGATGVTLSNLATQTMTYLMIDRHGVLSQQNSFPTPQQRRQNIYLGKVSHTDKTTIRNVFPEPEVESSAMSQLRDMFTPVKLINDGVYPSDNGATLSFNVSSGKLWGMGIGFVNDVLNPNNISVTGQSPTTFEYRTQLGGTYSSRTLIDPLNYDNGGVLTAIGSPAKQATNQRIYLLQNGKIRVQYGQAKYSDLVTAISNIRTESFVTFPNFRDNAILIGILSISSDCVALNNTSTARFFLVSKFGETVGAVGGVSTETLQSAYENSTTPQITTNAILDGVTIRRGSTSDSDNILVGQDGAGNSTFLVTGTGGVTMRHLTTTGITGGFLYADSSGIISSTTSGGGGSPGPQGNQGPTGPTGPQGIQGPTGPQGVVLTRDTGTVSGSSFSGTPLSYTVTLGGVFTGDYLVNIESSALRLFTVSNKTPTTFDINSNSSQPFIDNVYYQAWLF